MFRYKSIEEVYSQAALGVIPYPFVLQPYVSGCRDLRVIVLDEYLEAYERSNPYNFRNNLHCGGEPTPCELTDAQLDLCTSVMQRGEFPYGHLDLMITGEGVTYFTEVNLRGGLRGAKISSTDYQKKIEDIHRKLCDSMLSQ
jgi:ribosomal protein S6--L-glutamate ligase